MEKFSKQEVEAALEELVARGELKKEWDVEKGEWAYVETEEMRTLRELKTDKAQ